MSKINSIAWSVEELVNQYENTASGHFFDKDTMRFFNSRVTGNFKRIDDTTAAFITTERGPSGIRRATVRVAKLVQTIRESDGREVSKINISTWGEFNELTLPAAIKELKKVA